MRKAIYTRILLLVGIILSLGAQTIFAQADLVVVQSTLSNSMYATTLTNNNDCLVNEGCVGGYGVRDIIRFSTHIKNVGNQDFYVGQPPNSPSQSNDSESWEWDECHNHWHYEGYAEYLLFDASGNLTPIGYKNGFCLIDIECSGGGTFTYTCSNQGISAGCGDIYGSGLPCQWIDVTDVPDGTYSLVVRANWDGSPDANGLYESTYVNNEAEVCFNLTRDASGDVDIEILGNSCNPNTNCYDVTLTINTDEYPTETTWAIQDENQDVVFSGGPYLAGTALSNHSLYLCLPEGCYDFIMYDSQGDGLCCGYGQGDYQLADDSGNILASGGEFGFNETTNFCVGPVVSCPDADSDGLCEEDDCNDNDATVPAPPGVACDDNDPNTTNDIILADGCTCQGTPCADADGDGICADDDCDDNDPNLPAAVGSACDDGDANTANDVIGADGCACAGTPCTDADGDGICAADDCNDNDANLPAAVGSACDDGDANTENDVIGANGCDCSGTPIGNPLDCNTIAVSSTGDQILITGFGAFPHVNIQIFTPQWSTANSCVDNCGTDSYLTAGYAEGTHQVSVKTFDATWNYICDFLIPIEVEGTTGPCTDNDNDDVCAADDCDDNNPNLPTAVGSACDDGNANTENDVIGADGCSCAGTPIQPAGCGDISIVPSPGLITIQGFISYPHHNIQIFDSSWDRVFHCVDECTAIQEIYLDEGLYHVSVKTFNAGWGGECNVFIDVTVPGGGGPCPDADGDGVCANQDCDDNDPALPTTVGSSCDDGNADTENDVIQADGCSCAGEIANPGGGDCDAITIVVSAGEITISNLGSFPHVNIQIFDPNWTRVDNCVDNCGNPHIASGLSNGTHHVSVKTFDASWDYLCNILIDVEVTGGTTAPGGTTNNLILDADIHPEGVRLEWLTTEEADVLEYTLYRSVDGVNFEPVSKLHPKFNNGIAATYEYIDKSDLSGKVIYQVEEMSTEFEFLLSQRQEVYVPESIDRFDVFPNPAQDEVFVKVNVHEGLRAQVMLINGLGQMVAQKAVDSLNEEILRFDLAGLDAGIYAVYVQVENRKGMVKMLVVEPGR